jgi:hypothetical protein
MVTSIKFRGEEIGNPDRERFKDKRKPISKYLVSRELREGTINCIKDFTSFLKSSKKC